MPLDADKFGSRPAPFLGGLLTIEQLILLLYPTCLIPAIYLWTKDQKRKRHFAEHPRGCKRVGIRDPALSNLCDEYDDDKASGDQTTEQWKVKSLFIYPIKSCAPVELETAGIDGPGMRYDRQFAFAEFLHPRTRIDAPEDEKRPRWIFRTQRDPKYQKLALVHPEVWIPIDASTPHGWLVVKYPNEPSGALAWLDRLFMSLGLVGPEMVFSVPLSPPKGHTYPKENIVIWGSDALWKDRVGAYGANGEKNEMKWINYGVHVPHDFKEFIGTDKPLTLFGVDPDEPRNV